jgi:hypothetical protein
MDSKVNVERVATCSVFEREVRRRGYVSDSHQITQKDLGTLMKDKRKQIN